MGHDAWQMIGRTPSDIVAERPLRQGDHRLRRDAEDDPAAVAPRVGRSTGHAVVCVPSAITEVERRGGGRGRTPGGGHGRALIEQPMAAAIGCGLLIHEPIASLVIDVGGGTTEIALVSLGGVVASTPCGSAASTSTAPSRPTCGEYGIAVGERTAEEIKIAIGSVAGARRAQGRGSGAGPGIGPAEDCDPDAGRDPPLSTT